MGADRSGRCSYVGYSNNMAALSSSSSSTTTLYAAASSSTFSVAVSSTSDSCIPIATPPVPTPSGTATLCSEYYLVQSGDNCYNTTRPYGISLSYFLTLNTHFDCSYLIAGEKLFISSLLF